MIRIVVLIFSFFLLLSCSEEKRARIRASKADSIMYAAGDMRDYARILALPGNCSPQQRNPETHS